MEKVKRGIGEISDMIYKSGDKIKWDIVKNKYPQTVGDNTDITNIEKTLIQFEIEDIDKTIEGLESIIERLLKLKREDQSKNYLNPQEDKCQKKDFVVSYVIVF